MESGLCLSQKLNSIFSGNTLAGKMVTCLQTITIEMPTSQYQFFGMEEAPICPSSYVPEEGNSFIAMKKMDGSIITWWKAGEIIKINKEGVVKTWYPKPTLADSIKQSSQPFMKGFYFEFRSDSSVVSRMPDGNYYWSPPIPGKPEVGEQVFGYDYDDTHECSDSCPHDSCYECYASRQ